VKEDELYENISNKMQEKSKLFPKSLAFVSIVKKNKQAKK
jgi:hypothetical protein